MKNCALHRAGPCEYPLDPHHVIPKRRIRRDATGDIAAAIADPRDIVWLCRRHHHRIEHGWDRNYLAAEILKRIDDLFAFAFEYELTNHLERELRLYSLPTSLEAVQGAN